MCKTRIIPYPTASGHLLQNRVPWAGLIGCALVVLASCGADRADVLQGKNRHNSLPLPEVHYSLGNVRFDPLLDSLVTWRADSRTAAVYAAVKEAKENFEIHGAYYAMAGTATALAMACELGDAPLDRLVLAEALHQMTRCCFYHRKTFEPASTLLDSAIAISRQLAFTTDTVLQPIALLQLARHHDVMQGLTNRFGHYVQHLSPEDWTHASRIALHIKRDLLGLRGAGIIRSISNLALDHGGLCEAGLPEHCREIDRLARTGIRELKWLSPEEGRTYGEFIRAGTLQAWNGMVEEGRLDSIAYLLELNLRLLTGQPDYKLGDAIKQVNQEQSATHATSIVDRFHEYIRLTKADHLLPSYQALVDKMRTWAEESYAQGMVTGMVGLDRLTRCSNLQNSTANRDLPQYGIAGYEVLSELIRPALMQERQWMMDRQLADSLPHFHEMRIQQATVEEDILDLESVVAQRLRPADLRRWSAMLEEDRQLSAQLNTVRMKPLSEQRMLRLHELQTKLRPNETWVAVWVVRDWGVVGIGTRNEFRVDSLFLKASFGTEGRTVGSTLNRLSDLSIQGATWTPDMDREFQDLADHLFDDLIPPNTEHIVLSTIGRSRSPLIEALLTVCQTRSEGPEMSTLRSIRVDNAFAINPNGKLPDPVLRPHFLGVAPSFHPPDRDLLADVDMEDLLRRMNDAEEGMTRDLFGQLEHNVNEVVEANHIMHGVVLTDTAADETAVRGAFTKGGVLHFATHSMVEMRAMDRSGIILSSDFSPNGTGDEDNVWRIPEIRSMHLDADLVVLSACQTSVGPSDDNGFESSIAAAFAEAGCSNIITSKWKVDDRASHDIMLAFYRHLAEGKGKAEALFAAKAEYRRQHPEKGPHYWAPLVLQGDDRPLMRVQP